MSTTHATYTDYFSVNYEQARARFKELSKKHQGQLWSYPINQQSPNGDELSIDVARFGSAQSRRCLVLSSGTHGVEGFFGSAVQLALIETLLTNLLKKHEIAIVLIHAVNPYGFAHLRRVNEDNIDLNRNFMTEEDSYEGVDPQYGEMDPLLNPKTPPIDNEFFVLKAILKIIKHGFSALKNSVAQGQYEYEKGLFFGGKEGSVSKSIITQYLPEWIQGSRQVIHLDFHTGLGKWSSYVLAASQNIPQED